MTADEHRNLGLRAMAKGEEMAIQCLQALDVAEAAVKNHPGPVSLEDYRRARVEVRRALSRFQELQQRYDQWMTT
jgi:hypothetical protein